MSLSAIEIYQDCLDTTNADQNGFLSYTLFNRFAKRAELKLIEWLSGDVANQRMPAPWVTQKNKDWLSPFIVKLNTQVTNGSITRPEDYLQYENFYKLGSKEGADCDDDDATDDCNTPIEILDGQQYYERCRTYIEELKPSLDKPVAKLLGNKFEVLPADLGSVVLEYIRYPIYGSIIPKIDPVYNDEIPDVVTDFEWEENSREFLVWFITDSFANRTSNQSMKQFNQASNPKQ